MNIIEITFRDGTVVTFQRNAYETQVITTCSLLKIYQAGTCYCYPLSIIKNFEFDEDLEVFDDEEEEEY